MVTLFKTISYCIAVAIGISAVFLAILAPEIETWYQNKIFLARTQAEIGNIKEKLYQFDEFISKASSDEDIINILYESQLGLSPEDTDEVVYPAVDKSKQLAADAAISKTFTPLENEMPEIPEFVQRINQPRARILLILAGISLTIFAYIYILGLKPRRNASQT